MDERLLNLYNTELRHLRSMAGEFAREKFWSLLDKVRTHFDSELP